MPDTIYRMAGRKPVTRALPSLEDALSGEFGVLAAPGSDHGEDGNVPKAEHITAMLRPLILKHRQRQAQPFYAMRKVARHFGASVPTVAAAYAALEREGLLRRIRSSRTVMEPLVPHPRVPIRGVVALPIYMPAFLRFADIRRFFTRFEQAMRAHNFAVNMVFFEQGEDIHPDFAKRVLAHHPDSLLWWQPHAAMRETLGMIEDAGVRTVLLGGRGEFSSVPYAESSQRAFTLGLELWRHDGIRSVIRVRNKAWADSGGQGAEAALRQLDLPFTCLTVDLALPTFPKEFDAVHGSDVGWIFESDYTAHHLYWVHLRELLALAHRARVMLVRPIILPLSLPNPTVDAMAMDSDGMAETIAREIAGGEAYARPKQRVFQAEWLPRITLRDLADHFGAQP